MGEKNKKKGEEGLIAGCVRFGLGGSGVFLLYWMEVLLIWRKGERDPERRPRARVGHVAVGARKLLGAGVMMGGWWDFS